MADNQAGAAAWPPTTTMLGYFDMLPPELMLDIIGRMKMYELTILMRCSKSLHGYIEPEVYRHKFVRDIAMAWAIRSSKPGLVRRLVKKYGASPSFYGGSVASDNIIHAMPGRSGSLYSRPKLTLVTAMKNFHGADELLRMLIKLGACLDPYACEHSQKDIQATNFPEGHMEPVFRDQASRFPQQLVRMRASNTDQQEAKLTVFRYYYDTAREWFIKNRGAAPSILHSLPRLIRSGHDLPIVRFVLDAEGIPEVEANKARLKKWARINKRIYPDGANFGNSHAVMTDDQTNDDNDGPLNDTSTADVPEEISSENTQSGVPKAGAIRKEDDSSKDKNPAEGQNVNEDTEMSNSNTPSSYPLVDRPDHCGPDGAPISPLSKAILCNAIPVFDLLFERGADINGSQLDFRKHGPTAHALHIPIFAAAHVLARRKTHDTGAYWMYKCYAMGADSNHMALCKLSGKHRPYKPVSESLGYYAQGMSYPPIDKVYFWATPIDVFVDCLSLRYLRQRVRTEDDDFGGDDITYSAHSNMAVFLQNHASADLASRRAPPRRENQDECEEEGPQDVSEIYPGEPTDPSLDEWNGWKRVVSPVTLEILLDRITVSGMAHPVASSYAELLKSMFSSGLGQAARLMSKYDGPAPESRFPSWTSGAESVGRRTLAMLLLCDDQSDWQGRELHRYIVYAVRRADMLFMDKVIDNIEQAFSEMASNNIHVEGPYIPNSADDDVELQYHYSNQSADPSINRSQSAQLEEEWTALHEICRLWNLQMIAYEKDKIGHGTAPIPRFARQTATTMKLLATLVTHQFPIHQMAEEGKAPYELLLKDPDSVLSKRSVLLLETLGQYMKTTNLVGKFAVS